MTYEAQIALWGTATALPLAFNVIAKRGADAIGLSTMLVLIWTLGRILSTVWTVPENLALNPLIDCLAGMTTFIAWRTQPALWKLVLTGLYVGQSVAHLSFWAAWPAPGSLLEYLRVNNSIYALQLLVVASPGGVHVARSLCRSLPRRAGHLRHAWLGPWP